MVGCCSRTLLQTCKFHYPLNHGCLCCWLWAFETGEAWALLACGEQSNRWPFPELSRTTEKWGKGCGEGSTYLSLLSPSHSLVMQKVNLTLKRKLLTFTMKNWHFTQRKHEFSTVFSHVSGFDANLSNLKRCHTNSVVCLAIPSCQQYSELTLLYNYNYFFYNYNYLNIVPKASPSGFWNIQC